MRRGLERTYKFPGLSDEEVRSYYKKELIEKKWKYKGVDMDGYDWYVKSVYKNGYTFNYTFIVQKSRSQEYDWILGIYEDQ